MDRRPLPLLAGAACLAGVAVALAAAAQAQSAASSPIRPAGAWRWLLVAGLVGALVAYVAGVFGLRRRNASLLMVLALAAAVQLAPLAGPTLLSTDASTYWMYGRIGATLGGNPYADPPSGYAGDPAYRAMGSSWHHQTSLYGPVFTAVSEAVAKGAGRNAGRADLLFRGVAAASMLAVVGLAAALAERRAFAAAFVGWNPLLALHFAGGGHNDAPMMALVLLALLLAARGHPDLAGGAWVLAIGVKWVPLAFLGLWLVARYRRRLPLGLRGLTGAAVAVAGVSSLLYGTHWLSAAAGVSKQARREGSIGLAHWLSELGLAHRPELAVIGLFLIGAFGLLAWRAWRGRLHLGLSGSALAFGQGWLNPWYASWGTTLSAVEEDGLAYAAAIALTGLLLSDALPL
jgi:hypothetical protein